jgi:UDP-N-acetylmuramyl pentapeptide phosphotransferase/UDP-N-acetylglucosamine-1-phosphate transferase
MSVIILTSFLTFVLTFILLKFYLNISREMSLIDIPTNYNMHDRNVPTGSGIVFLVIYLIFLISLSIFERYDLFNLKYPNRFYLLNLILICFTIMSFYDDFKNLHPNIRFFLQIFLVSLSLPLVNIEIINLYLPYKSILIFIIFYWVYTINIINFIDGLDGFLTTYSIFFFFNCFIYFSLFDIQNFFQYMSLVILFISIAFLFFNKSPAKLFMGDSGSIFLGYLIGLLSLYFLSIERIDIMISLICYPFIDCSLTIINKIFNGKYPWERLFDYYFLKPVKIYSKSHNYVLKYFLIYTIGVSLNLFLQIYLNYKYLCILSIIYTIFLIKFYSKKLSS